MPPAQHGQSEPAVAGFTAARATRIERLAMSGRLALAMLRHHVTE